jgi:GNAT superfamily N-acetyltransferase
MTARLKIDMDPNYSITVARPDHVEALADIELAASKMFDGYVPESVPLISTQQSKFVMAQHEGRLWIALWGETPVGFALVEMLAEDLPHLEEIDVLPTHGRRGLGTVLVQTVLEWVASAGYQQMTLTTFRSVPWNMPFYARLGFVEIPTHELRPELETVVRDESDRGLDRDLRVVMQYRVNDFQRHVFRKLQSEGRCGAVAYSGRFSRP